MRDFLFALAVLCLLGGFGLAVYFTIKGGQQETANREWCNSKGGVYITKQCFKAEIISFYGD